MALGNRIDFDAGHELGANHRIRDLRRAGVPENAESERGFMGDLGGNHRPQLHELQLDEWGLDEVSPSDRKLRVLYSDVRGCYRERWQVFEARPVRQIRPRARCNRGAHVVLPEVRNVCESNCSSGRAHRVRSNVAGRGKRTGATVVHLDERLCPWDDLGRVALDGAVAGSRVSRRPVLRTSRGRAHGTSKNAKMNGSLSTQGPRGSNITTWGLFHFYKEQRICRQD